MSEGALRRLELGIRGMLWVLALAAAETIAFALLAATLAPAMARLSVTVGGSDLARGGAGLSLLLALQAALAFLVAALAALAVDLAPPVGAVAGLLASLLPALIAVAAEGPSVLRPAPLLALRGIFALVAAGAGALGCILLRKLLRATSRRP